MKKRWILLGLIAIFGVNFYIAHMQMTSPELYRAINDNSAGSIQDYSKYYRTLSIQNADVDMLYLSPASAPSNEHVGTVRRNMMRNMSALGAAKVRKTLFGMVMFLEYQIDMYGAGNHDVYWKSLPMEAKGLLVMIENLESIKEYVSHDKTKLDIETAQVLLQYAMDHEKIDGIFYAHHILSDLHFWGYGHGFDERELLVWLTPPDPRVFDTFYGVTATWGYSYPSGILDITEEAEPPVQGESLFLLKEAVEEKDAMLSVLLTELKYSDLSRMKNNLISMEAILTDVVYRYQTLTTYQQADMILWLNGMLVIPNEVMQTDIRDLLTRLEQYDAGRDAEGRQILVSCLRSVYELNRIVFQNTKPMAFENFYYEQIECLRIYDEEAAYSFFNE